MIKKLKTLMVGAVLIAALPLASDAQNNKGNNKGSGSNGSAPHDKVTLCHNGHSITISQSAYDAHMRNHNKEGAKLTCFKMDNPNSPCGKSNPKPPQPPTNCPPTPTCPDPNNQACQ